MTEAGGGPERVLVVLVTGPDADGLLALGRTLVEERLAACANVVPGVRSVFRWEGKVEECDEVLALLKTTAGRLDALTRRVRSLHPYDEPEVLAIRSAGGSASYHGWVRAAVSGG